MRGGRNLPPPPPLSTLAEGGGGIKCVFLPGYVVVFCRSVGRSPFFSPRRLLLSSSSSGEVQRSFVRSFVYSRGRDSAKKKKKKRAIYRLPPPPPPATTPCNDRRWTDRPTVRAAMAVASGGRWR